MDKLIVTPEMVHEGARRSKIPRRNAKSKNASRNPAFPSELVWTPAGGDIVFIEASRMRGGKQFTMTGHLGEVMQESMTAALTWVRANAERYDHRP